MFVSMLDRTWIPVAAVVGLASIGLSAQKGSIPIDVTAMSP